MFYSSHSPSPEDDENKSLLTPTSPTLPIDDTLDDGDQDTHHHHHHRHHHHKEKEKTQNGKPKLLDNAKYKLLHENDEQSQGV